MWEDELTGENSQMIYRSKFGPTLRGKSQKLSHQWIANLEWAISHCRGRVRVVVLTPEDAKANPRVIRSCLPAHALRMQITSFDRKTGCFTATTSADQALSAGR